MTIELFNELWATARRNKLRTALTGFAVAWGIFMIIFLLGAGNGLINAMKKNSISTLDNSITAYPGQTSQPYDGLQEGRSIELDARDIRTTASAFTQHVDEVGASVYQNNIDVSLADHYFNAILTGLYPVNGVIDKRQMLYGRYINDIDIEKRRKVLVISEKQAQQLTDGPIQALVGQYVHVAQWAFQVVGIVKARENESNQEAFTAYTTVQAIFAKGDKADNISFTFHGLDTEEQNDAFEQQYRANINANHRAAPDDRSTLWLWNHFTQTLQMGQGIAIVHTALWIVGLFTLLSGIVGVSNIMLITVKERTREFGIRKAIGAKPSSILWLIISESVVITTFFGYIGMLCGIGANAYMDATLGHTVVDSGLFKATMFVNPTVGLDVCIGATLVMVMAGTLAGLLPARRAARIKPIEALKGE